MKPYSTALLLLALVLFSESARSQTPISLVDTLREGARHRPLVVAHRGDSAHFPENTLPAFRSALVKSADLIELDFFPSRDGILYCHHDETLDRTTDVERRIGYRPGGRGQHRVSLAPRLCRGGRHRESCQSNRGLNRFYGTRLMASESVREEAGDGFVWRHVDGVRAKGKTEPVELYEPLGRVGVVSAGRLHFVRRYEEALTLFRSRSFSEAIDVLDALDGAFGEDISVLRLRRLAEDLAARSPADEWDGITGFDVK